MLVTSVIFLFTACLFQKIKFVPSTREWESNPDPRTHISQQSEFTNQWKMHVAIPRINKDDLLSADCSVIFLCICNTYHHVNLINTASSCVNNGERLGCYRPQTKFGARQYFHKHLSFCPRGGGGLASQHASQVT